MYPLRSYSERMGSSCYGRARLINRIKGRERDEILMGLSGCRSFDGRCH